MFCRFTKNIYFVLSMNPLRNIARSSFPKFSGGGFLLFSSDR